ncbi:MAG: sialidase family protein [Chitinophagaceae bacterium]
MKKIIYATLYFCMSAQLIFAQKPDYPIVPGVVVDYSPASSGQYLGSPSICILPGGDYVASHDFFGPKSTEHVRAVTYIFRSPDKGKTWKKISEINGQFWSKLFVHKKSLYIIGTWKEYGNCIIRKSSDGGVSWTDPTDSTSGLLRKGDYHCAPTPVIEYKGRLWRAMEDAMGPVRGWGKMFGSFMMSVPVNADLLNAANWTFSNSVRYDSTFLGGNFGGWLEGNAVLTPSGEIVNILRVAYTLNGEEKAAIINISNDGKQATFDRDKNFIDFPGGSKKFTIMYDKKTKLYWTLCNYVPESFRGKKSDLIRNTQALCSSSDLRNWQVKTIILQHPDVEKHGFQYLDWQFEGNDIIFLSRTAYDDAEGGAHRQHDANFITFHRIKNFRKIGMKDE